MRSISAFIAALLSIGMFAPIAIAASDVTFVLEPHCASVDRTQCPQYEVKDAGHLMTPKMNAGDILDLDVVLKDGKDRGVTMIRSWLKYDPQVLEARSVELTSIIAEPIPGEQAADPILGFVKIGGGASKTIGNNRVSIARVTFRVVSTVANTEISFQNYLPDGTGETAINAVTQKDGSNSGLALPPCFGNIPCPQNKPLTIAQLLSIPSPLTIILTSVAAIVNTALAEDIPSSPATSAVSSTTADTMQAPLTGASSPATTTVGSASSFTLLQVQGVRVTSRDQSIFLSWLPLKSSELAGYNVYYGTVSGKYIQRRSIPAVSTSLVLRDLEKDATYYMAVRAFNAKNQETVFSREVSVIVGNPDSSSAPLLAAIEQTPLPDGNPIETRGGQEINGTTGPSDMIMVFIVLSAICGTAFAAHRQMTLLKFNHVV